MADYHRRIKGCRLTVDDCCGRCHYWQSLNDDKGYCDYHNEGRREKAVACRNWMGKVGGHK